MQGTHHERLGARPIREPQRHAVDGGSELRTGPQDVRAIRRRRAGAAGSLEERNATVRAGASDVGSQAIAYAGQNAQASLDHAQSLLKAKDLTEVMRLHGEYVQAQMRALAEQASEIGRLIGSAAMESTKPKA